MTVVRPLDRMVQRDGQLQDAAGGAGDKGDLPEDQVGAVVDEDGGPHPQHDQDRFGPAGGGQPQDEKDVEDGHGGDLGHFHHGGVGGRRGGHRRAGQCAGVPQQGVDGGHGLGPLVVGHRDGEQGRPVLIIGFDGGGVLHLQGDGDLGHIVQPGDRGDPVHPCDLLFEGQGLGDGDVPRHGPHIGDAPAEGVLHHMDGGGGGGVGGQVIVDVVVDRDQQGQQRAQHCRRGIPGQHPPAAADDGGKKAFPVHERTPFLEGFSSLYYKSFGRKGNEHPVNFFVHIRPFVRIAKGAGGRYNRGNEPNKKEEPVWNTCMKKPRPARPI